MEGYHKSELNGGTASNRVNELDLLRFIAALVVVLFHYSFRGYAADGMSNMPYPLLAPYAKYGYLGLELFFMISGFVILMTAASGSLKKFFISRFVRLYPAFWVCCTITFIVTLIFGGPKFSASTGQYVINMTMLNELVKVPAIDGAYWSLFIEMKFYLLIFFVLFFNKVKNIQIILICWLVCSVFLEIRPVGILNFFLIPSYSSYFIAGAMFFLVWSQGVSVTRFCVIIASWCFSIIQIINRLPNFEKHYSVNMDKFIIAATISTFFIVFFLVAMRCTGYVGRIRWLLLGGITYPLYLIHQHVGFMIFNSLYPTINIHILLWGTLIVMLGVACLVHIFIEKKMSPLLKDALNRMLKSNSSAA